MDDLTENYDLNIVAKELQLKIDKQLKRIECIKAGTPYSLPKPNTNSDTIFEITPDPKVDAFWDNFTTIAPILFLLLTTSDPSTAHLSHQSIESCISQTTSYLSHLKSSLPNLSPSSLLPTTLCLSSLTHRIDILKSIKSFNLNSPTVSLPLSGSPSSLHLSLSTLFSSVSVSPSAAPAPAAEPKLGKSPKKPRQNRQRRRKREWSKKEVLQLFLESHEETMEKIKKEEFERLEVTERIEKLQEAIEEQVERKAGERWWREKAERGLAAFWVEKMKMCWAREGRAGGVEEVEREYVRYEIWKEREYQRSLERLHFQVFGGLMEEFLEVV